MMRPCAAALTLVAVFGFTPRSLRRCPMCAENAVRAVSLIYIDEANVQAGLECGQCGIQRRVITTHAKVQRLIHALERDRRAIGTCAVGMARDRRRRDFGAFTRVLRDDIVGAEDFLAATRG